MNRTIPRTGSEEIELYIRTYYSQLRSSQEVQVKSLLEAHANLNSVLHPDARGDRPDMSAFIYSLLRLPPIMPQVRLVVLGQSPDAFRQRGFGEIDTWQVVQAPARRRRCYFDGLGTLACYIGSLSDIDDITPILAAFQMEWNKLRRRLRDVQARALLEAARDDEQALSALARALDISVGDIGRLRTIWGANFWEMLRTIAARPLRLSLQLVSGSLNDYRRATRRWWEQLEAAVPALTGRPVYFVSSNTHSLVNLLSGYALRHEAELIAFINSPEHGDLLAEHRDIQSQQVPSSRENFLYYVLKKYVNSAEGATAARQRLEDEQSCGITRVASAHFFDVDAQVIDLSRLRPDWMDPRLCRSGIETLRDSDALILNIDYPLGMAAYLLLVQVAARVGELRGIYVMGKAATLNGRIGDVLVPNVVSDEHSRNTYLFRNAFAAADVSANLVYGTALDNQRALTVRGTFLQNPPFMQCFYEAGYTDIEMEAGPYLSAVYELYRPQRHPRDEIVDLHGVPFDLGFLHYASDTPLSKGKNLGSANLSYFGMDPTYANSIAILRRIFALEIQRQRGSGLS